MPIQFLNADDAIKARKNNAHASWPNRGSANRVEPIANPQFRAAFQLKPGEKIFTIGSCFARNVETALIAEGFSIPTRDLFRSPEFNGLQLNIINNFGVPSIYNELRWALEPDYLFDEQTNFIEVYPEKFVDLHLLSTIKPAGHELVQRRRKAVNRLYVSAKTAETIIITLGLSECWFDRQTQLYLNSTPLPKVLKDNPQRFEFHVLGYAEVIDYLKRSIELINACAKKPPNILLTVSPVPLSATHRDMDVMIANCYSKSALRTAAEEACYTFTNVHYYPSYEGVTLSARELAWMDDQVHVTKDLISTQVRKLLASYCLGLDNEMTLEAAIERAQSTMRFRERKAFFSKYGEQFSANPMFAIEYAKYLVKIGDGTRALDVLADVQIPSGQEWLVASAFCMTGDYERATEAVLPTLGKKSKNHNNWEAFLKIQLHKNNLRDARRVVAEWMSATPGSVVRVLKRASTAFEEYDRFQAIAYLRKAQRLAPDDENLSKRLERLCADGTASNKIQPTKEWLKSLINQLFIAR